MNMTDYTLVEFGKVHDYLTRCGIDCRTYCKTFLVNCWDKNGVIQSYYASTQTAIFRKGNEKTDEKRTVKDFPIQKFAYVCQHPEALNW